MSREIKFRAWDSSRKKMLMTGEFNILQEECYGFHAGAYDIDEDWVSFDLMQYIGLKDKNGKGDYLWQNDLVRCSGHGVGLVDQNYWGEWCVVFGGDFIPIHDLIMEQDLLERVGNIHENPELLS
jgi:hypothetical protein